MKFFPAAILPVVALLTACAGSPARLAAMSNDELHQQTPMDLCHAYNYGHSAAVKRALLDRGIVRPEQWATVDGKRVAVGMTDVELMCAWGSPDHINRASYGDQWVYGTTRSRQYVYVRSGIVTAWN
jgi:hypothetical protein